MGASMYMVNKKTTFTYDKVSITYPKGVILDLSTSSSLYTAIGAGNLTALTSQQYSGAAPPPGPEDNTESMGGGRVPYSSGQCG